MNEIISRALCANEFCKQMGYKIKVWDEKYGLAEILK